MRDSAWFVQLIELMQCLKHRLARYVPCGSHSQLKSDNMPFAIWYLWLMQYLKAYIEIDCPFRSSSSNILAVSTGWVL